MALQMQYREPSAAEIVSKSISLYRSRFGGFLAPFLLTNIANGLLWQLMYCFIPSFNLPVDFTEEFLLWFINYLAFAIPVVAAFVVLGWVLATLPYGIAVKSSSDLLEGRNISLKRGFSFVLISIPPLLTAGFAVGLLVVLGLILFVVPGLIVAVMFSLSVQVIVVERLGASESLRRSRKLVADRWWKTFSVLVLVFLVLAIVYMTGETMGASLAGSSNALRWLISSVITSLAQPIYPIALTYLYYSLRAREKLAESAIPVQPAAPAAPPVALPPAPAPVFQPRFCYKCGQTLPPDTVYCPNCGVRVRT